MNPHLSPGVIFLITKPHKFGAQSSFRQKGLSVPAEYFIPFELLLFQGTASRKEQALVISHNRILWMAAGEDGCH